MSAVGISWPLITTPQSTAVVSRLLSLSIFILDRPAPSQIPFRNSLFSRSRLFLYSSRCTTALLTSATASARAALVVLLMFGAMLLAMKNEVSECPSSDLPVPLGPNSERMGKEVVTEVTTSLNSEANRKQSATLALSPNTVISLSEYSRNETLLVSV